MNIALERITQSDNPVLVYGGCEYIDPKGARLFVNKSGSWAVPLLRFGPQLIPQPGALYNREVFEQIGGLNTKYQLAFDFDLFYSLSKVGKAVFVPKVLAKFRWHPSSLSVSKRRQSVAEASEVRVSHLTWGLGYVAQIWEFPTRFLTLLAGRVVSRKFKLDQPTSVDL
jgi:GT2 family glycosyltransferase